MHFEWFSLFLLQKEELMINCAAFILHAVLFKSLHGSALIMV
ncbi:hypothetical protein HMPREF0620_1073 [Parascardovia denticolens DSM 10105 = JCM 12538]|uniref:Uncharacterized protein n=1 Tax=Parascardovia denticolens DSM 10105 = JCM 12538 TaxID=864564 RepID=E6JZM2_PARDN|nr:hypothetical protein HMPREF0620_1073 [Parascardovia denticolens DSM 10105 = JCM 12538]